MSTEALKQPANAEIIDAAERGELSEEQIRSLEPKLARRRTIHLLAYPVTKRFRVERSRLP